MNSPPSPGRFAARAIWLGLFTALLVLFACHLDSPSASEDTFSFPTLKEKIGDADYVTIVLKDSTGQVVEVLYEGPVTASTTFQDLKAGDYQGGKVFIHIEAKKGEVVVYKTVRGYEPAHGGDQERIVYVAPPEKTRDSLLLEPDTLRLALRGPTGRFTARFIPATAARDMQWSTLDGDLLEVAADGGLTARAVGLARVIAASKAPPVLADTAHVRILGAVPVDSIRFARRFLDLLAEGPAESLFVRVYPPLAPPGILFSGKDSTLVRLSGRSVQGLKEGETWLVAQSLDNPLRRDSIPVGIFPPEQVDSVRLTEDSLRLYVNGEERSLTARVFPAALKPRFAWASESETVARVDANGKVSPVGQGKTWISVRARADSTKQDQALIVVKKDVPVLEVGGDTVITQGTTLSFHPVVRQEYGAVALFKWDLDGNGHFEDSATAMSADLSHVYGVAGTYPIRFYVRDTEGNDTVQLVEVKVVNGRAVQILSPRDGSFTLEGSIPVTWTVDGIFQTTTEVLQFGPNRIVRSASDSARNTFADTVIVYLDQTAPPRPVVRGPSGPINTLTPRWTWVSGDSSAQPGRGIGTYRFRLDDPDLSAAAATKDTFYTAATNLHAGTHTLFVQERDEAGNWSPNGTYAVRIDTTPPSAPALSVSPESPTNVSQPTWSWTGGVGDAFRYYRYKLDNSDFRAGARDTIGTSFQPAMVLSEGPHTLYVQERDSAGNWSPTAAKAVTVDLTPPSAPTLSVGPAALTNDATPTWTWTTATAGTVFFRFRLDNPDLTAATPETAREFTPGTPLSEGPHALYVQERDAAGNWSSSASRQVRIDITPPSPPRIDSTPYSPINSLRPRWTWRSGTGGVKVFRARVDTANLAGAVERTDSLFVPDVDLLEGSHVLYLQERDSAENWSSLASKSIFVSVARMIGKPGSAFNSASAPKIFSADTNLFVMARGAMEGAGASVVRLEGDNWESVGGNTFPEGILYTSIMAASDGQPVISYLQNLNSTMFSKYDGSKWSPLNPIGVGSIEGDFANSGFGDIYFAYVQRLGGKVALEKYIGREWQHVGSGYVSDSSGQYISLSISPGGIPHIAFSDARFNWRMTVKYLSGGVWTELGQPGFSLGPTFTNSIRFSMDGTPYVAFIDQGAQSTPRVMTYKNGSWIQIGGADAFSENSRQIALELDESGNPIVAISDNNGKPSVAKLVDTKWKFFSKIPLSSEWVESFSLTLSKQGVPVIAVVDGSTEGPIRVFKTSFDP